MRIGIKPFSIGLFFLIISLMYLLFSTYYFQQRETTSKIIVESIQNDLSELSYVLSKHMQKEPINTARALLDRKTANNDYIKAIAIFDDQKLLLTTDPYLSKVTSVLELHMRPDKGMYELLVKHGATEKSIHYYNRSQLKEYRLVFWFDDKFI